MADEVKTARDIVDLWHLEASIASQVFSVFSEVVHNTYYYECKLSVPATQAGMEHESEDETQGDLENYNISESDDDINNDWSDDSELSSDGQVTTDSE